MYRSCKLTSVCPKRAKTSGSKVAAMAVRSRKMFSICPSTSDTKSSRFNATNSGKSTGAPKGSMDSAFATSLS